MIIISKNGVIDVPYEIITLRSEDGIIRMNIVGDTGKGSVMAQYSTEEKAEKAMDMLHDAYTKNRNDVFRFPQDDEV